VRCPACNAEIAISTDLKTTDKAISDHVKTYHFGKPAHEKDSIIHDLIMQTFETISNVPVKQLAEEQLILQAIHSRAAMWHSDRCKRSSTEAYLERSGIKNAHAKVQALIDSGKIVLYSGRTEFIADAKGMEHGPMGGA
jgi:hypothetical protein